MEELDKRAFNAGYSLRQYRPELAAQLEKALAGSKNEQAQIIRAGIREHEREKAHEQVKNIQPDQPEKQDRNRGKDMDMSR